MTDSDVPQKRTIRYYSCEDLASHASIEACMLKPNMVRLAHELVKACQLPQHMAMCTTGSTECPLLTAGGAMCFHTDAYVDFLQQIAYNSAEVAAESADYALQSSVCFSETAWCAAAAAAAAAPPHRRRLAFRTWRCVDAAQSPPASRRRRPYARTYAGASVAAARALSMAATDVAINWMGGQTHARPDCASGFSYVNDVVLSVLELLREQRPKGATGEGSPVFERVMVVNVDAWHPSGVEEAFYTTDRVLCVSLHRHGRGVFPGSGGVKDIGEGKGKNHTINMPVSHGLDDEGLEARRRSHSHQSIPHRASLPASPPRPPPQSLFNPVVTAAFERYQPGAIVYIAGAGVLAGDRLGCMNITLAAHAKCLRHVAAFGKPLLVLGGGGSGQSVAARAWCAATAALCEVDLPEMVPDHDYTYYHGAADPPFDLASVTMDNGNSEASLTRTREACLSTISQLPEHEAAPPPPKPAPPAPPPAAEPAAAETAAETAAAEPTDAEPADAEPDAGAGPAADGAEPTGELVAVDAPMDTETGAASAPAAEAEEGSAVQAGDSGAAPPVSTQTVAENSTEIDATEPMVEG